MEYVGFLEKNIWSQAICSWIIYDFGPKSFYFGGNLEEWLGLTIIGTLKKLRFENYLMTDDGSL